MVMGHGRPRCAWVRLFYRVRDGQGGCALGRASQSYILTSTVCICLAINHQQKTPNRQLLKSPVRTPNPLEHPNHLKAQTHMQSATQQQPRWDLSYNLGVKGAAVQAVDALSAWRQSLTATHAAPPMGGASAPAAQARAGHAAAARGMQSPRVAMAAEARSPRAAGGGAAAAANVVASASVEAAAAAAAAPVVRRPVVAPGAGAVASGADGWAEDDWSVGSGSDSDDDGRAAAYWQGGRFIDGDESDEGEVGTPSEEEPSAESWGEGSSPSAEKGGPWEEGASDDGGVEPSATYSEDGGEPQPSVSDQGDGVEAGRTARGARDRQGDWLIGGGIVLQQRGSSVDGSFHSAESGDEDIPAATGRDKRRRSPLPSGDSSSDDMSGGPPPGVEVIDLT